MRTAQIRPHTHGQYLDDASHPHKKKMMLMKTPDLQAARTAVAASAACWQLGDRLVYRWRHRPRRGSDLRRGCSALAPLGGSPRGARPPARASSDHASVPPFVGAAVRGIIERQAALPSTRHPVRLRPQAGRQESRQAGQVDVREAQQGCRTHAPWGPHHTYTCEGSEIKWQ